MILTRIQFSIIFLGWPKRWIYSNWHRTWYVYEIRGMKKLMFCLFIYFSRLSTWAKNQVCFKCEAFYCTQEMPLWKKNKCMNFIKAPTSVRSYAVVFWASQFYHRLMVAFISNTLLRSTSPSIWNYWHKILTQTVLPFLSIAIISPFIMFSSFRNQEHQTWQFCLSKLLSMEGLLVSFHPWFFYFFFYN